MTMLSPSEAAGRYQCRIAKTTGDAFNSTTAENRIVIVAS